ncbi:MAG: DNA mismatch repair endonuclease MutL [Gemmataceae bacterium]|nr:DNA mismatch repair endonuclease MutL [Gemmata sp.]MDW8197013.1 DNA mismatch repair endonuclease MutL [Gemmataceae bacterium]
MPRIHQLPPDVVTKIAAGEVIERPASVVKELLENSIDAGASRIDIDLEAGGTELIRVVDDGCGIERDDLPLALAQHATSKLRSADDLFRIGTMGFRGEALASIAGVGQVLLQSRPPHATSGAELRCDGGVLGPIKPWNGAPGTRIEVKHLFYNVPVRKKFLKSVATELGHVCETVTRIALAYPTLHLTLRHNGRLVYEIPAGAGWLDRIALFFTDEVRAALYEIDSGEGPLRVRGFIADPRCDRGNPKLQYFFVNGRWIRDRSLAHALQESYRGLLMTGRYAVGFLFLTVPPDQVDVNVHPTKAEVRFQENSLVYSLVRSTIKHRLLRENLIPQLTVPQEPEAQERPPAREASTEPKPSAAPPREWRESPPVPKDVRSNAAGLSTDDPNTLRSSPRWHSPPTASLSPDPATAHDPPSSLLAQVSPDQPAVADEASWGADPRSQIADTRPPTATAAAIAHNPPLMMPTSWPGATALPGSSLGAAVPSVPASPRGSIPFSAATMAEAPAHREGAKATAPSVIQLHDSYLVLETPDGMLVIDQHALHERILYEQLRCRVRDGQLEVQRLLIPEPIDLPAEQAALVLETAEALRELGLEVSEFGGNTILLSSYPTLLSRRPPHEVLRGVIDHLLTQERPPTKEALLHLLMATMACKAAIKAGDKLSPEEMTYLLNLRAMAENSHHCPHGRPTSLLFHRAELDRQFRRTGTSRRTDFEG